MSGNPASPVDGVAVTLTCSSSTGTVDSYKWYKGGTLLDGETSATYAIAQADIGTHDGDYTCEALESTVSSDASSAYTLAREFS